MKAVKSEDGRSFSCLASIQSRSPRPGHLLKSCSCLHVGDATMGTHRRPPEKPNCHSVHQTCTTSSFLLKKSLTTVHEVVAFLTGLPKHCTPPHILHCRDQPAGQGPGRQVPCPHRRKEGCLRCPFFQVPNFLHQPKSAWFTPYGHYFQIPSNRRAWKKKDLLFLGTGEGFLCKRGDDSVPAKCLPRRGIVSTSAHPIFMTGILMGINKDMCQKQTCTFPCKLAKAKFQAKTSYLSPFYLSTTINSPGWPSPNLLPGKEGWPSVSRRVGWSGQGMGEGRLTGEYRDEAGRPEDQEDHLRES